MAGTVRKGVDSVAERTSGGTSDASSAFGASTCASNRMRQAVGSSAHEAGRRPLLSGTAACSAVTVLQLYPTLTCHTTRLLDGTHASTRNTGHAPLRHAARTFNRRCAASIVPAKRRMALRGTQGYSAAGRRACNEQSGSCNNRRVHAAWQLHPSAMPLYETRYHNGGPTGAVGY
jgi:hypothetical protein